MAPDVIVADEIGGTNDSEAINYVVCSGVKCIFTAHGEIIEDLYKNPELNKLMNSHVIERILILSDKDKGKIDLNTDPPKNDSVDKDNSNQTSNGNNGNNRNNKKRKTYSSIEFREKTFGDKKKQFPIVSAQFSPHIDLSYEVRELLGDAILYDKKSRSLVLEFSNIRDAIQALNILPFGLGYKIFLLNAA